MRSSNSVFNNDSVGAVTDEVAGIRSQPPTPLGAIYREISDAVNKVSEHVNTHPNIEPSVVQDFNSQLTAMVEGINAIGEAHHQLDYAKEILERKMKAVSRENSATGWIGGQHSGNQSVTINNAFGRVVGSFAEL